MNFYRTDSPYRYKKLDLYINPETNSKIKELTKFILIN